MSKPHALIEHVDPGEPEAPRRLTPSERNHEMFGWMREVIVSLTARRGTSQRESNTVTRNAKGDVQIETVTYRRDDESEDDFNARTEARFDRLGAKYALSRSQEYGRTYLPNEKDPPKGGGGK